MKINSVTGSIETKELGFTLMHEHIFAVSPIMRSVVPDWFDRAGVVARGVEMIGRAKKTGVKTIVDMTGFQLGRDARIMQEIAEKAEFQIVACSGYYIADEISLIDKSPEFLAEIIIGDIEKGMEGTGIKASIIKCATGHAGFTEMNLRYLEATAIAAKATGAPIYTHSCGEYGYHQARYFIAEGVRPEKIVIGHVGDTTDIVYLSKIAELGCYLGCDRFGLENHVPVIYMPSENRIETLVKLKELGYNGQVVVSHDCSVFIDFWEGRKGMGNPWQTFKALELDKVIWQYDYIGKYVLPELRRRGYTEEEIEEIVVGTPRKIFEA